MMTLLEGAGEFVLWCMALVIGVAFAGAAVLWAWDKYRAKSWEKTLRGEK